MSNLNTKLMTALLKNESIDEVFRSHLEAAMNDLFKIELTQFLGYEKSNILGYNTGNSRNGFFERDLDTSYGRLHIKVPCDRNAHFEQQLIPDYARRTDEPETTIITLYKKGITTREISNLIEKIYGHPYSPATMSNISKAVADQVENFHKRQLSERYAVIFMDVTYLNVRRDSVVKEPLHVLIGITPDGTREVLDYALYPTETAANYEEMMESIKKRYPKPAGIFERAEESLYPFYKFPEAIRKSIYTTNMIERSNKGLKHKSKVKEQFPNEDALERFVCCYYCDLNCSYSERTQRGSCQASAEILQLFEEKLQATHKQDVV